MKKSTNTTPDHSTRNFQGKMVFMKIKSKGIFQTLIPTITGATKVKSTATATTNRRIIRTEENMEQMVMKWTHTFPEDQYMMHRLVLGEA